MKAAVRRMFEVPDSNAIHKIGFDPTIPGVDRGYLVIQFSSLDVWCYQDVLYFDYLMMKNAPSTGKAFHALIKGKYKGEQLNVKKDAHIVNPDAVTTKPKVADAAPLFDMMDASPSSSGDRKRGGRK
jgi:hypothetical protein